jgi:hypothetical protein
MGVTGGGVQMLRSPRQKSQRGDKMNILNKKYFLPLTYFELLSQMKGNTIT